MKLSKQLKEDIFYGSLMILGFFTIVFLDGILSYWGW